MKKYKLNKFLSAFFITLLFFLAVFSRQINDNYIKPYVEMSNPEDSIVHVIADLPSNPSPFNRDRKSYGTAWSIGSNFFMTAGHVVSNSEGLKIELVNAKVDAYATVVFLDKVHDYAILKLDSVVVLPSLKISKGPTYPGEDVEVVGYPADFGLLHFYGKVASHETSFEPDDGDVVSWSKIVILDMTGIQGESGGPVFDKYNEVIGMMVALMPRNPTPFGPVSVMVPTDQFQDLLNMCCVWKGKQSEEVDKNNKN